MSSILNRRRDPKAERNPEKEAYTEKPLYSFIKMALDQDHPFALFCAKEGHPDRDVL
jgi:hypothetical protein